MCTRVDHRLVDTVAPVCATHEDGYDVARTFRPHFKALIERGFVQFKMPSLERRGECLERRIGVCAREHRDAVGNIGGESSGTRDKRAKFASIFAPDLERFEDAKGGAGPRGRACRAEVAQRPALQRRRCANHRLWSKAGAQYDQLTNHGIDESGSGGDLSFGQVQV